MKASSTLIQSASFVKRRAQVFAAFRDFFPEDSIVYTAHWGIRRGRRDRGIDEEMAEGTADKVQISNNRRYFL